MTLGLHRRAAGTTPEHVADGKPNKVIAAALFISEGTAKTHINSLLGKLGAADRTQAVTIALRRGILRLD
jgi:DNA-binding NarL/FixJ family response regulator